MKNTTLLPILLLTLLPRLLPAQPPADHASGPFTTGIYEFAADGDTYYARGDRIVIASDDRGITWEPLGRLSDGVSLLEIEATDGHLWGVTDAGLYRWRGMQGDWTEVGERIVIGLHATPKGDLIATDRESGDLVRSEDLGESWSVVEEGYRMAWAANGSDGRIWVTDSSRVLVSDDDGRTWKGFGGDSQAVPALYLYPLDNGNVIGLGREESWMSSRASGEWLSHGLLPDHEGIVALFEDPNRPGAFILGLRHARVVEPTLYHLTGDSGRTWTSGGYTSFGILERYRVTPQHAVLVDRADSIVLIGASFRSDFRSAEPFSDIGQIIRSVPGDIHVPWTLSFTGSLGTSRITSLEIGPDGTLYAGRQMPYFMDFEHGTWAFRSDDGGDSWEEISVGEEGALLSVTSDGTLFVTASRDALFRSTDRGEGWDTIRVDEEKEWRPVGRIIEVEPDLLLVETVNEDVELVTWMSTDSGVTWSVVGVHEHFGGVTRNVVDRENRIWTIGGKLVYRSLDSGRTWSRLTVAKDAMDFTSDITLLHNGNPLVSTTAGRLYTSNDQGESWVEVPSDLTDTLLVVVTDDDGILYGGGQSGTVWRSSDDGRSWRAWVRIPETSSAVTGLGIGADGYLYIGTEWQGVWRANIGEIGDVPGGGRRIERIDLR